MTNTEHDLNALSDDELREAWNAAYDAGISPARLIARLTAQRYAAGPIFEGALAEWLEHQARLDAISAVQDARRAARGNDA